MSERVPMAERDAVPLNNSERIQRINLRNFLLHANLEELAQELAIREEFGDAFGVAVIKELMEEVKAEERHSQS